MSVMLQDYHVPNKKKLPLYGPLAIENQERFLWEESNQFLETYMSSFPYQLEVANFNILYQIGEGAFGTVMLVKYKLFGSYYAMKVLNKKVLVERDYVNKALNEKLMLQSLNCPFTIYLIYFSQDNSNIYFILPFIQGGDLYTRLKQFVSFNENLSKFYAAQIVLAFEYLHRCSVVYRDLKPENILLDHIGYIKVADFGLAKMVHHRTYTFCGTPEYVAPEIVLGLGHWKAVDWWTLGVLIFEMSTGRTPFVNPNIYKIYENIIDVKYVRPKDFNEDLKHLVENLLQRDTTRRIGNLKSGVEEIKNHSWFKGMNWLHLFNRTVIPPFIPTDAKQINNVVFPGIKQITHLKIEDEDIYGNLFTGF